MPPTLLILAASSAALFVVMLALAAVILWYRDKDGDESVRILALYAVCILFLVEACCLTSLYRRAEALESAAKSEK